MALGIQLGLPLNKGLPHVIEASFPGFLSQAFSLGRRGVSHIKPVCSRVCVCGGGGGGGVLMNLQSTYVSHTHLINSRKALA